MAKLWVNTMYKVLQKHRNKSNKERLEAPFMVGQTAGVGVLTSKNK